MIDGRHRASNQNIIPLQPRRTLGWVKQNEFFLTHLKKMIRGKKKANKKARLKFITGLKTKRLRLPTQEDKETKTKRQRDKETKRQRDKDKETKRQKDKNI